jgi:hypothetical protein
MLYSSNQPAARPIDRPYGRETVWDRWLIDLPVSVTGMLRLPHSSNYAPIDWTGPTLHAGHILGLWLTPLAAFSTIVG